MGERTGGSTDSSLIGLIDLSDIRGVLTGTQAMAAIQGERGP